MPMSSRRGSGRPSCSGAATGPKSLISRPSLRRWRASSAKSPGPCLAGFRSGPGARWRSLGGRLGRQLAQIVPGVQACVVAVVEYDPNGIVADRLDVDDPHVLLSEDLALLARRVPLDLGARTLDPEALGSQAHGHAVVEGDLERAPLIFHHDVGRPG